MNALIDITKALNYPIEKGVFDHLARTKSLLTALSAFKKLNNSQKKNFKEAIRCLYQNSVEVNCNNIDAGVSNL